MRVYPVVATIPKWLISVCLAQDTLMAFPEVADVGWFLETGACMNESH